MQDIAIIISASNYQNISRLSATARDADAVELLLTQSQQFDQVFRIDGDTGGAAVKDRLIEIKKTVAADTVDQLLFYFSGHGTFDNGRFYYLFSDYSSRTLRQNSLEDLELDQLLRSMSPQLCVKIVDACQSGVNYIKDGADIAVQLAKSKDAFSKVYFMFSSSSDQYSYADSKLSDFTRSIIRAVVSRNSNGLRYKDIIDFVSDDFATSGQQTPYFVTQADFTEIFLPVNDQLRDKLRTFLEEPPSPDEPKQMSLIDRVRADESRYHDKETAVASLNMLADALEGEAGLSRDLLDLYSIDVTREEKSPPNPTPIGRWIDSHRDENGVFARATRKTEIYQDRVPKSRNATFLSLGQLYDDREYVMVEKTRQVIDGFQSTTDMPFTMLRIHLAPKLKNLGPEECYVVPLVSRTVIRIFYTMAHFQIVDWSKSRRDSLDEWLTVEIPIGNNTVIDETARKIKERFSGFVIGALEAKYLSSDGEEGAGTEASNGTSADSQ